MPATCHIHIPIPKQTPQPCLGVRPDEYDRLCRTASRTFSGMLKESGIGSFFALNEPELLLEARQRDAVVKRRVNQAV